MALIACMAAACGRLSFDVEEGIAVGPDAPVMSDAALDGAGYRATAVRFEPSTNDFMWTSSLADTTNSTRGTFSAWFRFNGGDGEQQLIAVAQVVGIGGVVRTASNRFHFTMQNCVGLPMLDMQSRGTYTTASGWVHVLASWDVSAGRADLYVDDLPDRAATMTMISGAICYDSIKWGIGGLVDGRLDADVADLYAALGTYIDFSVEANRRLFRDADGKPVDLGWTCKRPTGSPASGCFVGDAETWNVNQGEATGFTLEGNGLAPAPTSPSD
jgi:hypothetical protein